MISRWEGARHPVDVGSAPTEMKWRHEHGDKKSFTQSENKKRSVTG